MGCSLPCQDGKDLDEQKGQQIPMIHLHLHLRWSTKIADDLEEEALRNPPLERRKRRSDIVVVAIVVVRSKENVFKG